MIAPHDVNTIKYVNEVTDVADIKFKGDPSKIEIIGEEVDKIFLEKLKVCRSVQRQSRDITT